MLQTVTGVLEIGHIFWHKIEMAQWTASLAL
jgi:hypothetical protein